MCSLYCGNMWQEFFLCMQLRYTPLKNVRIAARLNGRGEIKNSLPYRQSSKINISLIVWALQSNNELTTLHMHLSFNFCSLQNERKRSYFIINFSIYCYFLTKTLVLFYAHFRIKGKFTRKKASVFCKSKKIIYCYISLCSKREYVFEGLNLKKMQPHF